MQQHPWDAYIHIVINRWDSAANHQQDQVHAEDEAITLDLPALSTTMHTNTSEQNLLRPVHSFATDQVKRKLAQVIIPHKVCTHDQSLDSGAAVEDDFQSELDSAQNSNTAEEDGCQPIKKSLRGFDGADDYSSVQETPKHCETAVVRTVKRTFSSMEENGCDTPDISKRVSLSDEETREFSELIHSIHQAQAQQRQTTCDLELAHNSIELFGLAREQASHSMLKSI